MKTALSAAAIGVAMLTGYGLSAQPAQAGYVVDLTQGVNVVASGTGAIDLTGLTPSSTGDLAISGMAPFVAFIITGPFEAASIDVYTGVTGPARFGPGGGQDASSGTGDSVGVEIGTHMLFVPSGYVSEHAPIGHCDLHRRELRQSRRIARNLRMDVGDRGEPELHTRHRGSSRTLDVGHDAARLRRTGLGWMAAPPDRVQRLVSRLGGR
jgi:hypothetical protein